MYDPTDPINHMYDGPNDMMANLSHRRDPEEEIKGCIINAIILIVTMTLLIIALALSE